uniref:SRR1-like domain-containing protein n=1 Tax=Meloidogyne incognita TaxID=6306 RepID=A0A914LPG7_MELIC
MGLSIDEWTLVIRHGNKGRRFKTFTSTLKCKAILNTTHKFNNDNKTSLDYLTTVVTKFKNNFPESFRHFVVSKLEEALNSHNLAIIRVFGIGPISTSQDSLWQLALLLHIKEYFGVEIVTSQDPLTSELEEEFLQSCGIQVLPPDDLLSTPPSTFPNDFTLLYMIHCTQDMYENILSSYSSKENVDLQRIILIGNDPVQLSSATNNFNLQCPNLMSFTSLSTIIPLPYFEPKENSFHGTSICFIEENDEN